MSDLLPRGTILSQTFDFTIVDKIAEGGMGEVYEAILHGMSGFEKRVALKVVRADFLDAPGVDPTRTRDDRACEFFDRLVHEAKLVSNLIHTHIVQIYLLGDLVLDGKPSGYIAMEYVNGVNLRSFIDRHLFENRVTPWEIAVYIASRLARALEYAHAATSPDGSPLNIVHRDVTPTNVLLSVEGVVKLSDFGIAKAVTLEEASADYVVGKRRYMAPEQAAGGSVDFRADLFSLGLLLDELLTNRLPDRRDEPAAADEPRRDIPPEIHRIIERATRPDPAERYASTGEVAVALERAIYEKGYGPTFVTLAEYVARLFPAIRGGLPAASPEERTVIHRADGP